MNALYLLFRHIAHNLPLAQSVTIHEIDGVRQRIDVGDDKILVGRKPRCVIERIVLPELAYLPTGAGSSLDFYL